MKVLWIVNILFPEAERQITGVGSLKSSGGWLLGAAEKLARSSEVELAVATPSSLVNDVMKINGDRILYYVFPLGKGNTKYNKKYEHYWRQINEEYTPDVIHIHGTEFSHGLAYVRACGNDNVVVSIQGLVSEISNYYNLGLTLLNIIKNITLRDLLRGTLLHNQISFRRKGRCEVELLQSIKHVIGRTSWDRAHVWAINPNAKYHFCNETLRPDFYKGETWEYEKCVPHTIFLSQASYPVKGLHIILQAMPLILRHFPDTKIRVAGEDITKRKEGIKGRIKISGYGKIVKTLIKKYKIENNISFLGNLDASEMIKEYLRANVFVCPSSIENSPNSLCEAQTLGTPVVASYAGGIPDMMKGDERHMYRFDDMEMLAYTICHVFEEQERQVDMKAIAMQRHDMENNMETTITIYNNLYRP